MPRIKWRTVSCADDSLRSHPSKERAYDWVAEQEPGSVFRVQFDKRRAGGWQDAARLTAVKPGWAREELAG